MSVCVVRAFVKLRGLLAPYKGIMERLDALETTVADHDDTLKELIATVRSLIMPQQQQKQPIGFHVREHSASYRSGHCEGREGQRQRSQRVKE